MIEARKLIEPTSRSKKFFNPSPAKTQKQKPPKPFGPTRLRASGGYTDHPPTPQASNDKYANYLNEPESQNGEVRAGAPYGYI